LPTKNARLQQLEQMMAAPGFWDNSEAAQQVVTELKALKSITVPVVGFGTRLEDLQALYELAAEDGSDEMAAEAAAEVVKIATDLGSLELRTLLSGPHDMGNCFFSIHSGAGGTEACDWAEMLLRMYLRYFERVGLAVSELDRVGGDMAGIRSITLNVKGPYAYGYLSCERGVHRLVRISPFNAQDKRQTSFASVDVLPVLADIEIDVDWAAEVREDTFCASGAGGQHVNKTASAVRLTHLETGIVVQCQNERSQHKNRAEARKMLGAKLYQHAEAKRDADLAKLYSNKGDIAFGSQIRSYVLYPYQLVRDERTELKSSATGKILDGEIQEFIDAYLRYRMKKD